MDCWISGAGRPGLDPPGAFPGPARFIPAADGKGGDEGRLPKDVEAGRCGHGCCCCSCRNEPVLVEMAGAAVLPAALVRLVGLLPRLLPGLPPRFLALLPMAALLFTLAGREPLPELPAPAFAPAPALARTLEGKRPLTGREEEEEAAPRRVVGAAREEGEAVAGLARWALLEPVRDCRVGLGLLVAEMASRMAGPPVVERSVLESVAERAAMEAGGRGRGFGGPLSMSDVDDGTSDEILDCDHYGWV